MKFLDQLSSTYQGSGFYQWFTGRSVSDQRVLIGIATLVGLAALYSAVWVPISDYRDQAALRENRAQLLDDWIVLNKRQLQAPRGETGSGQDTALIPLITTSANARGLSLSRLQPESDGGVSVVVNQQPFDALLNWISHLEIDRGLTIDRISIERTANEGFVNALLRVH